MRESGEASASFNLILLYRCVRWSHHCGRRRIWSRICPATRKDRAININFLHNRRQGAICRVSAANLSLSCPLSQPSFTSLILSRSSNNFNIATSVPADAVTHERIRTHPSYLVPDLRKVRGTGSKSNEL